MDLPDSDPSDVLCREILAEADHRGQEIVEQARQEAGALVTMADTEAQAARMQRLEHARAEADRRVEAIRATVGVEAGRMRAAHVEALLDSLFREGRLRLAARQGLDDKTVLIALSAHAIERMDGDTFVLRVAPGAPVAVEDLRRATGRSSLALTLREDPSVAEGGLIIEDAEGRQVWDNRLPQRLVRLWPELRQQIVQRLTGGA